MRHEEPELSQAVAKILTAEGVDVRLSMPVIRVEHEDDLKTVVAGTLHQEERFTADLILLATGHVPQVDGLGLDSAGVQMTPHGIKTTDSLQTTAANIWSIGDVNGGTMFTHRATYDGPLAVLNAVKNKGKRAINSALYYLAYASHHAIMVE